MKFEELKAYYFVMDAVYLPKYKIRITVCLY